MGLYDIVTAMIGHTWQSNYSGDQSYIYNIVGCIIILAFVQATDMLYRTFAHFWRA